MQEGIMNWFTKLLIGLILAFILYFLVCYLFGLVFWFVVIGAVVGLIIGIIGYLLRERDSGKDILKTGVKMNKDAERKAERALKELERRSKDK